MSNTGIVPQEPILEKRTYAAPLSYVGSARRISAWVRRTGGTTPKLALVLLVAVIAIPAVWLFVTAWYVVIFGLFFWFTIPFRLIRRSQRKSLAVQQAQLATMQAMMVRQQETLAQANREQAAPEASTEPELPPSRDPVEEAQDLRNWT